jgi:transcriptional regulator
MKKTNPMFRWHLTDEEKQKIRELTLAGVRQSEIARQTNLTAPSVSRAQKAMGLPTHLPIPEKKIMSLFQKGWGGYKIARHLRVPVSAVYKIAHKNKFRRADSVGYPTPPENERVSSKPFSAEKAI